MPAPTASPAFRFSADGVTYGAVGAPITVAANAAVWAKIDNIANVNQVTWSVVNSDDLTTPGSYALTTSGPKGSVVKITAMGALGTGCILQATINAGVNPATGNVDLTMTATGKADVLAGNGLHIGCYNEQNESGAQGWLSQHNAAIRHAGGSGDNTLTIVGSLTAGNGSGGGPGGYRVVLPSTDFPGATSAVLRATIFAGVNNGLSSWAISTTYSVNDMVAANGTAWVCVTPGTSASTGPGPSIEGPSVPDGSGSLVWRSATANLVVALVTSSGETTLATLSVGYQPGAALSGPGASALNVSVDLSGSLIPLGTAALVSVGIAGDPADTGNHTLGLCSFCEIIFS